MSLEVETIPEWAHFTTNMANPSFTVYTPVLMTFYQVPVRSA